MTGQILKHNVTGELVVYAGVYWKDETTLVSYGLIEDATAIAITRKDYKETVMIVEGKPCFAQVSSERSDFGQLLKDAALLPLTSDYEWCKGMNTYSV